MDPFKPPRKGNPTAKRGNLPMGVGHIPSPPVAYKQPGGGAPPPSGRKQHGLLQTLNKLEQESEDRAFELIRLRVGPGPLELDRSGCNCSLPLEHNNCTHTAISTTNVGYFSTPHRFGYPLAARHADSRAQAGERERGCGHSVPGHEAGERRASAGVGSCHRSPDHLGAGREVSGQPRSFG